MIKRYDPECTLWSGGTVRGEMGRDDEYGEYVEYDDYQADMDLAAKTLLATKKEYREIINWIFEELAVPVADRDSLIQEAIAACTKYMP